MTDTFPAVTARQVIRIARKLGFVKIRESGGSHAVYRRHSDKRRVVISRHVGETIKRKTLKGIVSDMGLTMKEFKELL